MAGRVFNDTDDDPEVGNIKVQVPTITSGVSGTSDNQGGTNLDNTDQRLHTKEGLQVINPKDLNEEEPKTPSSRKSVTFSADLEDVEELIEDEDEATELADRAETVQNDVFTDENSFLLGPEFEGVEPTYV